jgi:hypothetical protein
LIFALMSKDGPLLQVTRLLGAVATLSEAAGGAAGKAFEGASAVASSATEVVLSVATNTLSLSSNAWSGIDLYNLTAHRCSASITADSGIILNRWFSSDAGRALLPCIDDELLIAVSAAVGSITLALPELETTSEDLVILGSYGTLRLQAGLVYTGQVRVIFDSLNMSFEPVWANPIWQTLGLAHDTEHAQILHALRDASVALPAKHMAWNLSDVGIEGIQFWSRLYGRAECLLRLGYIHFWALSSLLGADNLRGLGVWFAFAYLFKTHRAEISFKLRQQCHVLHIGIRTQLHFYMPNTVSEWIVVPSVE